MNFGDMSFQDYFLSGTSNNNLANTNFIRNFLRLLLFLTLQLKNKIK